MISLLLQHFDCEDDSQSPLGFFVTAYTRFILKNCAESLENFPIKVLNVSKIVATVIQEK